MYYMREKAGSGTGNEAKLVVNWLSVSIQLAEQSTVATDTTCIYTDSTDAFIVIYTVC